MLIPRTTPINADKHSLFVPSAFLRVHRRPSNNLPNSDKSLQPDGQHVISRFPNAIHLVCGAHLSHCLSPCNERNDSVFPRVPLLLRESAERSTRLITDSLHRAHFASVRPLIAGTRLQVQGCLAGTSRWNKLSRTQIAKHLSIALHCGHFERSMLKSLICGAPGSQHCCAHWLSLLPSPSISFPRVTAYGRVTPISS